MKFRVGAAREPPLQEFLIHYDSFSRHECLAKRGDPAGRPYVLEIGGTGFQPVQHRLESLCHQILRFAQDDSLAFLNRNHRNKDGGRDARPTNSKLETKNCL